MCFQLQVHISICLLFWLYISLRSSGSSIYNYPFVYAVMMMTERRYLFPTIKNHNNNNNVHKCCPRRKAACLLREIYHRSNTQHTFGHFAFNYFFSSHLSLSPTLLQRTFSSKSLKSWFYFWFSFLVFPFCLLGCVWDCCCCCCATHTYMATLLMLFVVVLCWWAMNAVCTLKHVTNHCVI